MTMMMRRRRRTMWKKEEWLARPEEDEACQRDLLVHHGETHLHEICSIAEDVARNDRQSLLWLLLRTLP